MWPRNISMTVSFVVHDESVRTRTITYQQGFMPNYNVWTEHGERGIMLENDDEEENAIHDFGDFGDDSSAFFEDTTYNG
jgi:hypothetical protein